MTFLIILIITTSLCIDKDVYIRTFGNGFQNFGSAHNFFGVFETSSGDIITHGYNGYEDYLSMGLPTRTGSTLMKSTQNGTLLWLYHIPILSLFSNDAFLTSDNHIIFSSNEKIFKFSEDGTLIWGIEETNIVVRNICEVADGNYIFTGQYSSITTPISFFACKISKNGNFLWRKEYTLKEMGTNLNINYANPKSLLPTNDGGVLITGTFLIDNEHSKFVVYKLNTNGDVVFIQELQSFTANAYLNAASLIEYDDGTIIIAGDDSTIASSYMSIVEMGPSGSLNWMRQYWINSKSSEGAIYNTHSITKINSGGYIICGTLVENSWTVNATSGIIIVALSSYGTIEWMKLIRGGDNKEYGNTICNKIVTTESNDFYIAAQTNGNVGSDEAVLIKLSKDYKLCCMKGLFDFKYIEVIFQSEFRFGSQTFSEKSHDANITVHNNVSFSDINESEYYVIEANKYLNVTEKCAGYSNGTLLHLPKVIHHEQCAPKDFDFYYYNVISSSVCVFGHFNLMFYVADQRGLLRLLKDNGDGSIVSIAHLPVGSHMFDMSSKYNNKTLMFKSRIVVHPCTAHVVIISVGIAAGIIVSLLAVVIVVIIVVVVIVIMKNRGKNVVKKDVEMGVVSVIDNKMKKIVNFFQKKKKQISNDDGEEIESFLRAFSVSNEDFSNFKGKWISKNGKLFSKISLIDFKNVKLKKFLGAGGSGSTVFLADLSNSDGSVTEIAFKSYRILSDKMEELFTSNSQSKMFNEFKSELSIFLRTSHPYVLKLKGIVLKPNYFGIAMEFCLCGDLRNFISQHSGFSIKERIKILGKIASGMAHLHFNNIIHRDLKLENILITEHLDPKIMDFGISRLVVNSMSKTKNIGTVKYQAPELVLSGKYNEKVDVFSYSILAYELLTGDYDPFNEKDFDGNLAIEISTKSDFRPDINKLPKSIDKWLRNLIMKGWDHVPDVRPAFVEICKLFQMNVIEFSDMKIFKEKMKRNPITIYILDSATMSMDDAKDVELAIFKFSELTRIGKNILELGKIEKISLKTGSEMKEITSDEDVELVKDDSILFYN